MRQISEEFLMSWLQRFLAVIAALLGAPSASRADSSDVEHARYVVVSTSGEMEIRDYAPQIVAQTIVSGERDAAISQGFRLIAGYIFGDNTASKKIAMTAPVTQQSGEKIAMTAPVTQQGAGDAWKVRFVMPAGYTLDTLPHPNNQAVRLEAVPGKRFAAIRFSGFAGDGSIDVHTRKLQDFLASQKLSPRSPPVYAFYDPPWTLPFNRRNEVLIEITSTSESH